jgi:hypothetical protein
MHLFLVTSCVVQILAVCIVWIVCGFRAAAFYGGVMLLSWPFSALMSSMHMQWAMHLPWLVAAITVLVACLTRKSVETR